MKMKCFIAIVLMVALSIVGCSANSTVNINTSGDIPGFLSTAGEITDMNILVTDRYSFNKQDNVRVMDAVNQLLSQKGIKKNKRYIPAI